MSYPVYFLQFADHTGLDFALFNTIRLGRGWATRLHKGDRVLLSSGHLVLGSARVSKILTGRAAELLQTHAAQNHVERALALLPNYSINLAPHRRLESMRKNYGPQRVGDDPYITVIYLKV